VRSLATHLVFIVQFTLLKLYEIPTAHQSSLLAITANNPPGIVFLKERFIGVDCEIWAPIESIESQIMQF
jgi:hypothetical protein